MTKPSSFSTICTSNCAFELVGLLLSLSVYHTNETIYVLTDTKTKVANIDNEEWNKMSSACYEWYQRNVHSKNCWKNMIEYIWYE